MKGDLPRGEQWSVELGKLLAKRIAPELRPDGADLAHDSSTNALIQRYRRLRAKV